MVLSGSAAGAGMARVSERKVMAVASWSFILVLKLKLGFYFLPVETEVFMRMMFSREVWSSYTFLNRMKSVGVQPAIARATSSLYTTN